MMMVNRPSVIVTALMPPGEPLLMLLALEDRATLAVRGHNGNAATLHAVEEGRRARRDLDCDQPRL